MQMIFEIIPFEYIYSSLVLVECTGIINSEDCCIFLSFKSHITSTFLAISKA